MHVFLRRGEEDRLHSPSKGPGVPEGKESLKRVNKAQKREVSDLLVVASKKGGRGTGSPQARRGKRRCFACFIFRRTATYFKIKTMSQFLFVEGEEVRSIAKIRYSMKKEDTPLFLSGEGEGTSPYYRGGGESVKARGGEEENKT